LAEVLDSCKRAKSQKLKGPFGSLIQDKRSVTMYRHFLMSTRLPNRVHSRGSPDNT